MGAATTAAATGDSDGGPREKAPTKHRGSKQPANPISGGAHPVRRGAIKANGAQPAPNPRPPEAAWLTPSGAAGLGAVEAPVGREGRRRCQATGNHLMGGCGGGPGGGGGRRLRLSGGGGGGGGRQAATMAGNGRRLIARRTAAA
ncbi:translation initiation factor IF-2-like [Schistocerca gregaria]|uniref:translation initiation factor IF-2-like n=1 Tax=Schistocerca gregaria TaxID=7010 RepID=UPI00211E9063|nr:translation initiation factor IF-2-like [Schistocerca gregaria]